MNKTWEELAKIKAKVSAYDDVKPVKQLDHDGRHPRPDYENTTPWKERNHTSTWDSSAVRSHYKDERSHHKDELRQKSIIKSVHLWQLMKVCQRCVSFWSNIEPYIDIDVFNVNAIDFHYFMVLFNEILEKKVNEPRGKLT